MLLRRRRPLRRYPFVCGMGSGPRQAEGVPQVILRRGRFACPGHGLRRWRARQGTSACADRPACPRGFGRTAQGQGRCNAVGLPRDPHSGRRCGKAAVRVQPVQPIGGVRLRGAWHSKAWPATPLARRAARRGVMCRRQMRQRAVLLRADRVGRGGQTAVGFALRFGPTRTHAQTGLLSGPDSQSPGLTVRSVITARRAQKLQGTSPGTAIFIRRQDQRQNPSRKSP